MWSVVSNRKETGTYTSTDVIYLMVKHLSCFGLSLFMLLRRFLFSHGCCYITHNFLVNPCSKATAKSEAKSEVKSEANHVEIPEPVKAPVAQVEDPWPRFRERGKDDELVRLVGKVG